MKCVKREQCGCYDKEGKYHGDQERVPSIENCQIWYAIISCKQIQAAMISSIVLV